MEEQPSTPAEQQPQPPPAEPSANIESPPPKDKSCDSVPSAPVKDPAQRPPDADTVSKDPEAKLPLEPTVELHEEAKIPEKKPEPVSPTKDDRSEGTKAESEKQKSPEDVAEAKEFLGQLYDKVESGSVGPATLMSPIIEEQPHEDASPISRVGGDPVFPMIAAKEEFKVQTVVDLTVAPKETRSRMVDSGVPELESSAPARREEVHLATVHMSILPVASRHLRKTAGEFAFIELEVPPPLKLNAERGEDDEEEEDNKKKGQANELSLEVIEVNIPFLGEIDENELCTGLNEVDIPREEISIAKPISELAREIEEAGQEPQRNERESTEALAHVENESSINKIADSFKPHKATDTLHGSASRPESVLLPGQRLSVSPERLAAESMPPLSLEKIYGLVTQIQGEMNARHSEVLEKIEGSLSQISSQCRSVNPSVVVANKEPTDIGEISVKLNKLSELVRTSLVDPHGRCASAQLIERNMVSMHGTRCRPS